LTHLLPGREPTGFRNDEALEISLMTSEFLYSAVVWIMVFFFGLWTLVLGVGFVLSLRDKGIPADESLRLLSLSKK
jgi:hypothetical protein